MVLIEARCGFIDRVDHDETCGHNLGGRDHAVERFGEQRRAEALAVEGAVECETGEQDCGYLARPPTPYRRRELLALQ